MALKSRLGSIAGNVDGIIDRIGTKGAHDIEARAKQIMGEKNIIDTGATVNSIAVTKVGDHAWRIGPSTDYALFLEVGHHTRGGSFVPARPYMGPAGEAEFPGILAALKAAVEGAAR